LQPKLSISSGSFGVKQPKKTKKRNIRTPNLIGNKTPLHIVSAIAQVIKGQHSYKKRKRTPECLTYIKEKNYEASDEKETKTTK
jgi:hypothetical protein